MKVLVIGQLPKEVGGNYTTGAANVVFELSKQQPVGVEYLVFGTNIKAAAAAKASKYPCQYIGYNFNPLRMIWYAINHPIDCMRHLLHYKNVDHQNVLRFAFYEDNIRNAIKKIKPDLIHVNSIANVSPTRFAIDDSNIPMLLTCHGIFYRGDEKDIVNRDRNLGNIKLADAYSGLTRESLDEYESILGISKDRVTVIPNGVDCKKFYFSPKARKDIRREMKVSDECKVFITVASVQERKGQLDMIKLLEQFNGVYQYWIIGKGPDEEIINGYIQSRGLSDKVKLLGYRKADQLYKYYSAADIYAHPSWKEGQALSELEANATGLRTVVNKAIVGTIASDVTSADYYVIDFDDLDLAGIEAWVKEEQMERQSKSNFDWSVIANKYAELYRQIIENK